MASDVENLFICSVAISIPSSGKCVFVSFAHLLIILFGFFECEVLRILYSRSESLLGMWLIIFVSHSVPCLFIKVFHRAQVLNLDEVQFINMFCYGVMSKTSLLTFDSQRFSSV